MTKEELAQDLAYVRTLAEEGRHAPLIGGGFLVFFGALLSLAYALHWALRVELFGALPGDAYGMLWSVYVLIAAIGGVLGGRRVRKLPGALSIVNRVDRAVWQSAALAILVVVGGCIARLIIWHDLLAPNAIMAAAFAMFGVALRVTAAIAAQAWLRVFAWLAFAASAVLWVYMNEPWAYLLAAVAGIVVLVVPGVMMMRREPAAIV